jgi:hypothetical protein
VFVFVVVIEIVSTWLSRTDCATAHAFPYSPIPELVDVSIHMTAGAFVVFLMRHESRAEASDDASSLEGLTEGE